MPLKYDHLEGLEFDMEKQNCFTIIRQFYKDNFDIELSDYACPTNWWNGELDLYMRLAPAEGFTAIHTPPREWKGGDIIIMAIGSSTGNHSAVVLDNGNILHHLVGQRSAVTPYGGMFRNTTVATFRHKDLWDRQPEEVLVDIKGYLPPHVLRRLEQLEAAREPTSQETG